MGANESKPVSMAPPFDVEKYIEHERDKLAPLCGTSFGTGVPLCCIRFPNEITTRPGFEMAAFAEYHTSFLAKSGMSDKTMLMRAFIRARDSAIWGLISGDIKCVLYFHQEYLKFLCNYGTNLDIVKRATIAVQFELRHWTHGHDHDHHAAMHLLRRACIAGRAFREINPLQECRLQDLGAAFHRATVERSYRADVDLVTPRYSCPRTLLSFIDLHSMAPPAGGAGGGAGGASSVSSLPGANAIASSANAMTHESNTMDDLPNATASDDPTHP